MSQQRQCSQEMQLAAKASRRIVLPIEREQYAAVVQDGSAFRAWVDTNRQHYPELFPGEMREGYQLHDLRSSRKLPEMQVRRIRLKQSGAVYRVLPSFVLPYMVGYTAMVEKALFLRRFGVPFWGLTYVFGRSDMYWYRMVEHLGRFDVVGTTLKAPDHLPEHLLAAANSSLKTVRYFGKFLHDQYSFIRAALEHEWSNGQTEGQINRLKFIKRQMYGRASSELLRQKVLYHPGST